MRPRRGWQRSKENCEKQNNRKKMNHKHIKERDRLSKPSDDRRVWSPISTY